MRIIALLLVLGVPAAAGAQPFDVALAGVTTDCVIIDPPFTREMLQWVGGVPSTESPTGISLIAAGPGRIYGIRDGDEIVAFRRDTARTVVATLPAGLEATGLVVDRAGNMYVVAEQGAAYTLLAFTSAGALRDSYALGSGFRVQGSHLVRPLQSALDLAADQCTLYLIQNDSVIRRFNACTGTFLPDFATLPRATDVRVLPDGGLLVTRGDELARFDSSGAAVRTYAGQWSEVIPVALASGGATAWIAEHGCTEMRLVFELDLASGNLLSSETTSVDLATSLVASNAWTAAIGSAALASSDIPSASIWGLLSLTVLLIGTAVRRML